MAEMDQLADQLLGLEDRLGASAAMVAAFDGELARLRDSATFTSREVSALSNGIAGGLRRAFDGLAFDGLRLSDALKGVAQSIVDTVYSVAMRPIHNAAGGAIANGINAMMSGLMPFANGAGFAQGRVMPFANGGVVTGPVSFPMRGGRGLMGEAGPEAIMPLTRGADGRLGVQAQGGGRPVNVVMNISTPDVAGFRRSESQIAAQMGRALARGQRNR
ncbi:phage tail tape measure protein [Xinfangfangia sp. D13-10-4-6]|uniref:phage tail tape measure protein n=1 Tax=Pseudogemmobacter hezensis TaxID=2737662 RepID=UPI00155417EB|nr:phage tail tape measure protein [Pseudogemmobacter hezensis]NPD15370.1 phage tail tape measure protein [Pseudogemmobacter hezensis]